MTTIDGVPTLTQFLAMRLARRAKRSQAERASNRMYVGAYLTLVRLTLHLAGFSCLTYAAFMWDMIAGFIAAGICCFALSTLLTGKTTGPIENHR